MKHLEKDLNAVLKELKELIRKTEGMVKIVGKLEKTKVPKKAKAKARPKVKTKAVKKRVAKKATAIDTVFAIIKKSRKGVNAATLKKKTGFDDKKVWNNVNTLKRKGKIKSAGRGVYVKA
jgi:type II secretory pathway predicted ATPase ExeA